MAYPLEWQKLKGLTIPSIVEKIEHLGFSDIVVDDAK